MTLIIKNQDFKGCLMRVAKILLFQIVPIISISQVTDFSGIWALRTKKSIAGVKYDNGLPLYVNIASTAEGTVLKITSKDGSGNNTESTERFQKNGDSCIVTTPLGRKKKIVYNSAENEKKLTRDITLSFRDDINKIEVEMNEVWSIISMDNVNWMQVKKKSHSRLEDDDWQMEGLYERILPEQMTNELGLKNGIQFISANNWKEVLELAKKSQKYIFVDCFATWCGPCKRMDKEVYTSAKLGSVVDKRFISVKIQMDSTPNDDEITKEWYADAHAFQLKYNIRQFPSFLFFSPDGQIVHRDIGYNNVDQFLNITSVAIDSTKQYYPKLAKYNQGKLGYASMPDLAVKVKLFGGTDSKEIARKIALDCKVNYLDKLQLTELLTLENVSFYYNFYELVSKKDPFIKACILYPREVDSAIEMAGFAKRMLSYIIQTEEMPLLLFKDSSLRSKPFTKDPDWEKIKITIGKTYGSDLAISAVKNAMSTFYLKIKYGRGYVKLIENALKESPPKKSGTQLFAANMGGIFSKAPDHYILNIIAWNCYASFDDKYTLKKALEWSKLSIVCSDIVNTEYMDTKAHLLYKIGRRAEAIQIMKEIITLQPSINRYQKTYDEMVKGK